MEELIKALPAVLVQGFVLAMVAIAALVLANRAGLGDVSKAVDRETDRLVATQAERIKLLEGRVEDLESQLELERQINESLTKRIDDLERLVSDEQIRKILRET